MKHSEPIAQMRGAAVLVVVAMHANFCFSTGFIGTAINNGYYGVALFFVVSGFLIASNILNRYGSLAAIDMRDFYVMRAARILPCLMLLIAILSVLCWLRVPGFVFPEDLSLSGALQNVATLSFNGYYRRGAAVMLAWGILWSLSIEEVFYLSLPLTSVILRSAKLIVALLIALIVYGTQSRNSALDLVRYFSCFDLLAIGVLTALAAHRFAGSVPANLARALMVAGTVTVGSVYFFFAVQKNLMFGPLFLALGAAAMLFASRTLASGRPSILGAIGSLSYEIYLFHGLTFLLVANSVAPENAASYVVFSGATILVLAGSYAVNRGFSQPANTWIRRRFSRSALKNSQDVVACDRGLHDRESGATASV